MNTVEIRTGLRKLEFNLRNVEDPRDHSQEALVEFVRGERLRSNEMARVALGYRDGTVRELVGRARLIAAIRQGRGKTEYHYRLEGPIARSQYSWTSLPTNTNHRSG